MNREQRILEKLQVLTPHFIELKNDSAKHAGHTEHLGGAGFTGETHYKLILVSDIFLGLGRIERQRKVNELLSEEFKSGLHAFEMKTLTIDEYIKN
jgi:stress-induced morphogen